MSEMAANEAVDYVCSLHLEADPFADGFQSDYFYGGAMRHQLLGQLVHFSRFSEQVVLLLGAAGSGVSTLLAQALSQLQEVMDCCCINAEVISTPDQLLAYINQQFNLQLQAPIDTVDLVDALRAISMIEGDAEQVLIAIDQAHYLPIESFELFRELFEQVGDGVQLVFAGEYQVEQLLALSSFSAHRIKQLELPPLSATDTAEYLLGVLRSVSYIGPQPLSQDQLIVLQEQSGGNLAEINRLAATLLSSRERPVRTGLPFGIPVAHLTAIVVLVVAVGLIWWYQGAEREPAVSRYQEIAPSSNMANVGGATVQTEVAVMVPDATIESGHSGLVERNVDTTEHADVESLGREAQGDAVLSTVPDRRAQVAPLAEEIKAEVVVEVKPKPRVVAPPAPKKSEQAVVAVAAKSIEADEKVDVPIREQRLLSLVSAEYMLQLMGSVDEDRTRSFVKTYVGRLPVTYFATQLKGKPWYVAVVGPYRDKEQALAAIKQLPAALQKQRPWARTVESVQKEIKVARSL